MWYIFILILMWNFALVKPLSLKIVGGREATILQHPYQASIRYDDEHICGGAILSQYVILTAAHCVYRETTRRLSVRLGSSWHRNGASKKLFRVHTHPLFDPVNLDYDVAVLIVLNPIAINMFARPIALQPAGTLIPEGTSAIVTGWGSTLEGGMGSEVLRRVYVTLMSNAECDKSLKPGDLTDRMLCAYRKGHDSCQGDSGGPLVVNSRLVGIVSWGYGCARPGHPGIYANVSHLHTWIKMHIYIFIK